MTAVPVWGLGEVWLRCGCGVVAVLGGCGVVAVSACMSGTRGSDVLSSTGDVPGERCWWSV